MHSLQLFTVAFLVRGVAASPIPVDWDEGSTTELPTSAEENTWEGRFDSRPARGVLQSPCGPCKQLFSSFEQPGESENEIKLQQAIETACQQSQEPHINDVCEELRKCECLFETSGGRDQQIDSEHVI
ncbi:hypothetical protein M3Y99_00117900 [Aphelenchoides fujianensis]|nr:hypothetical protein M3Y99_00117900 [Aphelenchoides fujianensis]